MSLTRSRTPLSTPAQARRSRFQVGRLTDQSIPLFEITKADAAKLLERATYNQRSASQAEIARYTRIFEANKWDPYGTTPWQVDAQGHLRGGFKRAQGFVAAQRGPETILVPIIFNISEEAVAVSDTGRSRSLADQLAMQGMPAAALIAPMVRMAYLQHHTMRIDAIVEKARAEAEAVVLKKPVPAKEARQQADQARLAGAEAAERVRSEHLVDRNPVAMAAFAAPHRELLREVAGLLQDNPGMVQRARGGLFPLLVQLAGLSADVRVKFLDAAITMDPSKKGTPAYAFGAFAFSDAASRRIADIRAHNEKEQARKKHLREPARNFDLEVAAALVMAMRMQREKITDGVTAGSFKWVSGKGKPFPVLE